MSGEAYVKRYSGGFVDLPTETTPIDSAFLNAVESVLVRLLGVDPTDRGAEIWDTSLARFKTALIKNENIDSVAAISRNKLDFGAGLVDADIAPGAAIASSKISGLSGTAPPAGGMMLWGGTVAPAGWLLCDGSIVSRATQAGIFSVLGTFYGAGDGSTTFALPDFRGRVPVGVGTHADVGSLGLGDAEALGSRRPRHKHTATFTGSQGFTGTESAPHTHQEYARGGTTSGGALRPELSVGWTADSATSTQTGTESADHYHGFTPAGTITVGPQTGAEPTDGAAYLTINVIIKT